MKTASTQDGLFGWLLCTMSFLNYVILGGFIYVSGMFYLMFKDSLNGTDSEIALITSIHMGVMHTICPFVGILCEYFGSRRVAVAGAVISTGGLACSAFSTQIFHLYICYGIIAGAGHGVINIISLAVLDPYFYKYKRLVCSIALTGFGFGSFIMPPVLTFLEDVYGWRGAILLLAGINAHMMLTCSLYRPFGTVPGQKQSPQGQDTVISSDEERSLLPFKAVPYAEGYSRLASAIKSKGLEMLSLFRVMPFLCLCVYELVLVFSTTIILTHFGSYLLTLHFTSEDVVKLYMTLGVSATVSRPLAGVVAEVTHANTAMFIMLTTLLNGILTMSVPFMEPLWMLYVFSVLYKLLDGPYVGLGAAIIMESVPTSQVTTAYGVYILFTVPGYALGAPIAAWLYDYTHVYAHTFYLAGGLILLAGLTMAPTACCTHKEIL